MNELLKVNAVSFRFPEQKENTLKNISLSLTPGEKLAVIGETGSGKTTLLKCISSKLTPSSGEIVFMGEKVVSLFSGLLPGNPRIKIISQDFDLHTEISAEENIRRKLLMYDEEFKSKKTKRLLTLSGLTKLKNKKPAELSGGQQQLLSVCCAVAEEPALLLLDEPFSHLDHIVRMDILGYLSRMAAGLNVACILVSHDAADVLGFAQRILVMKRGRIAEENTPEELYFKPQSEYTAGLLDHYNISGKKITRPSQYEFCSQRAADFSGIVTEVIFRGPYYEISVDTGKRIFIVYSFGAVTAGEKVFLRRR